METFSAERFSQAVLVQYQQTLDKGDRVAAQRYISSFMEHEVRFSSLFPQMLVLVVSWPADESWSLTRILTMSFCVF